MKPEVEGLVYPEVEVEEAHRHWCERCYAFWSHGVDDQPECGTGSLLTKGDAACPEHRERQEEP